MDICKRSSWSNPDSNVFSMTTIFPSAGAMMLPGSAGQIRLGLRKKLVTNRNKAAEIRRVHTKAMCPPHTQTTKSRTDKATNNPRSIFRPSLWMVIPSAFFIDSSAMFILMTKLALISQIPKFARIFKVLFVTTSL